MAATSGTTEVASNEEAICRYCFETREVGELIAPCSCSGGQRWVHLACLRRWQSGVLVDQPTHPDFYDDDERHRICNVCKSEYTCKPPTRLDLMESYAGKEATALVNERCLIVPSAKFSAEMRHEVRSMPEHVREALLECHWVDGVYLIAQITKDDAAPVELRLPDKESVSAFADQLSQDWCWQVRGRRVKLVFEGPLRSVCSADDETKMRAIRALDGGSVLKLAPRDGPDPGEDQIIAVNLTRPFELASSGAHIFKELRWRAAMKKSLSKGDTCLPNVTHFIGGPCECNKVGCAILVSNQENFSVHSSLEEALVQAQSLRRSHEASPCGQEQLCSSKRRRVLKRPSVAKASSETSGTAKKVGRPTPPDVDLKVFWGVAGWSRCQLVGEIARGSWGLCKSSAQQIASADPGELSKLYASVSPQLTLAPASKLSEDESESEMTPEQRRLREQELTRKLARQEEAAATLRRLKQEYDNTPGLTESEVIERLEKVADDLDCDSSSCSGSDDDEEAEENEGVNSEASEVDT